MIPKGAERTGMVLPDIFHRAQSMEAIVIVRAIFGGSKR